MDQKLINILFVITGLSYGGAEMMLFKLMQQIDRKRFLPHVISLTDIGDIGRRISDLNIPVEALGMRRSPLDIICLVRILNRLRKIKPEIVHTWMYHADLIGGLASRLAHAPLIIWSIYSSNLLPSNTNLLTKLTVFGCTKLSSWIPDCIQYDSFQGKSYHETIGFRERYSLVIPNGVDLSEFKPDPKARQEIRQEIGVAPETPIIGLVARFDPIKNHEGFIEAASYLHCHMPNVHFLMAGQSVDWANPILKNTIEKYSLTNVFHLLGHRIDIPRITAALDLACLSSFSESFGIVLIEAMACGVPCVSTDCGEQALILGNKDWIIPIGDMEGLAAKWLVFFTLSENERRLIGEAVRARVMNQFELSAVVKQYENMYLNLIK